MNLSNVRWDRSILEELHRRYRDQSKKSTNEDDPSPKTDTGKNPTLEEDDSHAALANSVPSNKDDQSSSFDDLQSNDAEQREHWISLIQSYQQYQQQFDTYMIQKKQD